MNGKLSPEQRAHIAYQIERNTADIARLRKENAALRKRLSDDRKLFYLERKKPRASELHDTRA